MLDFPVRDFGLAVCLRVVSRGDFVDDAIFSHEAVYSFVAKVGSLVTYDCSWGAKATNDIVPHKRIHNISVIRSGGDCLNPF